MYITHAYFNSNLNAYLLKTNLYLYFRYHNVCAGIEECNELYLLFNFIF